LKREPQKHAKEGLSHLTDTQEKSTASSQRQRPSQVSSDAGNSNCTSGEIDNGKNGYQQSFSSIRLSQFICLQLTVDIVFNIIVRPLSNAEQAKRIVTIARQLSIEPATPDEARRILVLKGLDKVNW
jgi:hypothetical protein